MLFVNDVRAFVYAHRGTLVAIRLDPLMGQLQDLVELAGLCWLPTSGPSEFSVWPCGHYIVIV